jgi:hypothetical protein
VITGILLNHTEGFSLKQKQITNALILDWYGIEYPPVQLSKVSDHRTLLSFNQTLYVNAKDLHIQCNTLLGVLENQTRHLIALCTNGIVWLNRSNKQIANLTSYDFGLDRDTGQWKRIGVINDSSEIAIEFSKGNIQQLDLMNESLIPVDTDTDFDITWIPAPEMKDLQALSQEEKDMLPALFGLPVERLVQDIHSGRILGPWGVWLVDGFSLIFLFISLSGCLIWIRSKKKKI